MIPDFLRPWRMLPNYTSTQNRERRRAHPDHDAYFNSQFPETPIRIDPGQSAVSADPGQMIVTEVGAGMMVSAFDPERKQGGVAYIVMPEALQKAFPDFRHASADLLRETMRPLEDVLQRLHAQMISDRLRIRLVGASMMPSDAQKDAGTKTYVFVREYLSRAGLSVAQEDCAAQCIWRVHFFPARGQLVRFMLRREYDYETVARRELDCQKSFDFS